MLFKAPSKIVIVEPVSLIRDTLKNVVRDESDASIQGSLSNISALVPLLEMKEVNVIFSEVYDSNLSLIDGISILRKLKETHPHVDLIIYTEIEIPSLLIQTQADAIYSKRNSMDNIRINIREILKENKVISSIFYKQRRKYFRYSYLSDYEWKVLVLFCKIQNIKDIAAITKSSYKSISRIKRKIMTTLNISNNTQFKIVINLLNKKITDSHF